MSAVPPGRAGRLWLRQRLATATRAIALLEQKLRTLQEEERRLRLRTRNTGDRWQETAATAETWLLRATLAGGLRSIRLATTDDLAAVAISWTTSMGVRYPSAASCVPPRPPAGAAVFGGAALARAEPAFRAALDAAVQHAIALEALRVVQREIETTRQRVRALDRRWIPQLRQRIAELNLALEEQERAEALVRRRAVRGPLI